MSTSTIDWGGVLQVVPPASMASKALQQVQAPQSTVVISNPYDLEPVRKALAAYEEELGRMQAQAEKMNVIDQTTLERATELGIKCRTVEKAVEAARETFKRPAYDYGKGIDNLANAYKSKAKAAADVLAKKVGTYQAKVRAAEMEQLRKQQEETRALQARIDEEARAANVDTVVVPIPKAVPTSNTVHTSTGKATTVSRWVCRITDAASVPREYCTPTQTLLNDAVKAGIRNIPGCTIEQETTARFGA